MANFLNAVDYLINVDTILYVQTEGKGLSVSFEGLETLSFADVSPTGLAILKWWDGISAGSIMAPFLNLGDYLINLNQIKYVHAEGKGVSITFRGGETLGFGDVFPAAQALFKWWNSIPQP